MRLGFVVAFQETQSLRVPEASETYAHFVNASGRIVGSYVDADGVYRPYMSGQNGRFISLDLPQAAQFEYFFVHSINDVGTLVGRAKRFGDVPRTAVGSLQHGLKALKVPGSVSTEGWNINQDGSVVGHYDSRMDAGTGSLPDPLMRQRARILVTSTPLRCLKV